MSEHEFSEVITWPFAMTSEEISVWHKASPRMRKHVAELKRENEELLEDIALLGHIREMQAREIARLRGDGVALLATEEQEDE